jgi:DNA-binding NarL/FixJ family response regulator
MIRVVILMETEQDRKYFESLLGSRAGYKVVGVGGDAYDAIRLMQSRKPDIALLDEGSPLFDRGRIVPSLLFWSPETKVIILSPNLKGAGAAMLQALSAGAAGYFGKSPGDMIFAGIALVMQGWSVINPATAALAFRNYSGQQVPSRGRRKPAEAEPAARMSARMSRQELRLLACVGRGLSSGEISRTLKLSQGTVRNYLSSIYTKTGMHNRIEAALLAQYLGLPNLERAREPHTRNEE